MSHLGRYVVKRVLQSVPVVLGVTAVSLVLIHAAPGSPVQAMLGVEATPSRVERLESVYGLNQPIHVQYVEWLWSVLHGDLGYSFVQKEPVLDVVIERLPRTVALATGGMVVSLSMGVPLGVAAALRKNSPVDHVARAFAFAGVSTPNFWLGLVLLLVFAVRLRVLPLYGYVSPSADVVGFVRHLVLPSVALGTALSAIVTRMIRSELGEVLGEEYVLAAESKGLSRRTVVVKHGLRNALVPVVTVVGLQLGGLLGGAVIVEVVFAIPGLGMLLLDSVLAQDFPVVLGTVLVYSMLFVLVNLVVDVTYGFLDPRIRYGG